MAANESRETKRVWPDLGPTGDDSGLARAETVEESGDSDDRDEDDDDDDEKGSSLAQTAG